MLRVTGFRYLGFVLCLLFNLAGSATAMAQPANSLTLWVAEPKNSLIARHALYLGKQIDERLSGQFKVSIKTAPDTPSDGKLLGYVQKGELDLVLVSDSVIDAIPEFAIFRIPMLFHDHQHVQNTLYAGLEDELRTQIDQTLKVVALGVYDNEFHHIRAKTAIRTPADLKGLRILNNSGAKTRQMFRDLGAIPQKYPYARADEAIAKGIVDSVSGPLRRITKLPVGSQAPVITLSHHIFEPAFFLASQKFWSKLNDEQRAVFTELGVDFSDTAHQLSMNSDASIRATIPSTIHLRSISAGAFAPVIQAAREDYAATYGPDWLEYVDLALRPSSP